MDNIAGSKSSLTWAVHISVVLLVALWLFPTIGLLVSCFRTADQIATGGWWKAMFPTEQNQTYRATDPDDEGAQTLEGDLFVISGNVFEGGPVGEISTWGTSSREINAFAAGDTAELKDGETLTVQPGGDLFGLVAAQAIDDTGVVRVFCFQELQQLGLRVVPRRDPVADIGSIESGDVPRIGMPSSSRV